MPITSLSRPPGKHWSLSEIDWDRVDPAAVARRTRWVVRATCLVESRADLYTAYLAGVLRGAGRPEAVPLIERWGDEEAQHGTVLRLWLERADPDFEFQARDGDYRGSVAYYGERTQSVRGSLENELLCRCVVESLASAYYRAIRDSTVEPVLHDICERLARDEARHYKMFHTLLVAEGRSSTLLARMWVVWRRVKDLENDQIAYAFHACDPGAEDDYTTRFAALAFLPELYRLYRVEHILYALRMILHAVDLALPPRMTRTLARAVFAYTRVRSAIMKLEATARRVFRAGYTFLEGQGAHTS